MVRHRKCKSFLNTKPRGWRRRRMSLLGDPDVWGDQKCIAKVGDRLGCG
jgi:hypothetical protein